MTTLILSHEQVAEARTLGEASFVRWRQRTGYPLVVPAAEHEVAAALANQVRGQPLAQVGVKVAGSKWLRQAWASAQSKPSRRRVTAGSRPWFGAQPER